MKYELTVVEPTPQIPYRTYLLSRRVDDQLYGVFWDEDDFKLQTQINKLEAVIHKQD